jgi:hypothetical protein
MKNLLKHIRCPDLTVGAVFEHLFSSFTMEEDSSVVDRMKPGRFNSMRSDWFNSLKITISDKYTAEYVTLFYKSVFY